MPQPFLVKAGESARCPHSSIGEQTRPEAESQPVCQSFRRDPAPTGTPRAAAAPGLRRCPKASPPAPAGRPEPPATPSAPTSLARPPPSQARRRNEAGDRDKEATARVNTSIGSCLGAPNSPQPPLRLCSAAAIFAQPSRPIEFSVTQCTPGAVVLSGVVQCPFPLIPPTQRERRGIAAGGEAPDMAQGESLGAWGRLRPARRGPAERRPPRRTTTPRGLCGAGSPAPGGGAPRVSCPVPRREGGSLLRAGADAGVRCLRPGRCAGLLSAIG